MKFDFTVNLHITFDPEVLCAIRAVSNQEARIIEKLNHMAQELDDLKAAVAAETEVTQSAIALLNGLKAKLDAAIAAGDPAALKALSDSLGKDTADLAAAVTANTPSET